jgi:hypothetical protein
LKCSSYSWKPEQKYLGANYCNWRLWFILLDSLIAGTLTNPKMVLFHVRKISVKQIYACSGPEVSWVD